MSAIPLGYVFPNRPTKFLARLVALLAADAARRPPPPITLAGQPTATAEIPAPPVVRTQRRPRLEGDARIYRAGAEPEDHRWTYSRGQLLKMNARFARALNRAFKNGSESREAAGRLYGDLMCHTRVPCRHSPLPSALEAPTPRAQRA
jgi:hypothetical protein